MATYWVSNSQGGLFIFLDVILDPELESTDAFEEWYCANDIEKITRASVTNILWGELTEEIQEITPETLWTHAD